MRLLRWCRWYDADKHDQVEKALAAKESDLADLAARLSRLEAEVYPFGKRGMHNYPGSGRPAA